MPIYQFQCESCGPFEQRRSFQDAGEPLDCPSCSIPATRVFTPPTLYKTSVATRIAHSRNEKSADQPLVQQRSNDTQATHHHHHPSHHHHEPKRPWMIGH